METIGSKRSYALTWCMLNNDDDDDDDVVGCFSPKTAKNGGMDTTIQGICL